MKFEVVEVSEKRVSCCGNGCETGHPEIYLNLGDEGRAVCPYCSREFIFQERTQAS